ncbi:MAG: D-tyrosyl-tRNA(Tyr) deacylase [Anaerolineales bacterium]|nr:D-tyrosyl-tRNA(Tyr) deacylase [Anaerolineales bacterium]MBS3753739.1 D-tyrosyl-tRNA(Tyr) deacylase [Anaerolineales bacterium]
MKAILQRVSRGSVRVEGEILAEISTGLVILLGIGPQDGESNARDLAERVAKLRIFPDEDQKMNLSVRDVGGEALVIPQFTLYADTSKGNRPSFTGAAPPDLASPLVDHFVRELSSWEIPTQSGQFGAHMLVEIWNDGPVTISLEN